MTIQESFATELKFQMGVKSFLLSHFHEFTNHASSLFFYVEIVRKGLGHIKSARGNFIFATY